MYSRWCTTSSDFGGDRESWAKKMQLEDSDRTNKNRTAKFKTSSRFAICFFYLQDQRRQAPSILNRKSIQERQTPTLSSHNPDALLRSIRCSHKTMFWSLRLPEVSDSNEQRISLSKSRSEIVFRLILSRKEMIRFTPATTDLSSHHLAEFFPTVDGISSCEIDTVGCDYSSIADLLGRVRPAFRLGGRHRSRGCRAADPCADKSMLSEWLAHLIAYVGS